MFDLPFHHARVHQVRFLHVHARAVIPIGDIVIEFGRMTRLADLNLFCLKMKRFLILNIAFVQVPS